ncbi:bifunctional diguanylate cyclase/phosphodiesterase [Hydrogenimonas cancrithermarum]|uniref:bifunctional diguanylate cyclase/phosphodiesterase n=1 Tax=Hydrogenimonas cancrithermarum TaxID=2993563 RepID=UPI0025747F8A|nr:EAL domain-containing protein [Hydrogenimonas cancrithermarum]
MKYLFKKNLWTLFNTLAIIGFFLLLLIGYAQYRNSLEKFRTELVYLSKAAQSTTLHYLMQQEMLLDLLGSEITRSGRTVRREHLQALFDRLMKINPAIAGFAISDPDGNVYIVSSNNDPEKIPNLKQQPESRQTFLEALDSQYMVPGRVYYLNAIDTWILPLRKAIRTQDGKVLAVISIGLKLDDAITIWKEQVKSNTILSIVLDKSWYRIYQSDKPASRYPRFYNRPLDTERIDKIEEALFRENGMHLEDLRKSDRCALITFPSFLHEKELISWYYLPRYRLWIHYHLPFRHVVSELLPAWRNILILYFIVLAIVFYLFRTIDTIEKKRTRELLHQALHDRLTDLPNRIFLQRAIRNWIYPDAPPFAICFIDLDNFKNINDRMGHHYGDLILVEVAKRLKSTLSKNTLLIRHGGDEFILLLPECRQESLAKIAGEIIESVSKPMQIGKTVFTLGVSIGISCYPDNGEELFELLSAADIAMYTAKKRKNSFAFFSTEFKALRDRNSIIEQELRSALEKEEFYVVYQPQIDRNGDLHGVEALIRWESKKLGNVPPDRFVQIAEESGLMPKIGHFVLKKSLEEIGNLQKQCDINFFVSINVSIRQFHENDFTGKLLEEIQETGFDPSRIVIEITESLFIEELEQIVRLLQEIKTKGVRIALDDFGTGYSSLSLLKKLPIDELKIDKSFIDTLLTEKESEAMVNAIITLGKNLGFDIVAEGVEERRQYTWLVEKGCDLYQGYLFAKPMRIDKLMKFIEKSTSTTSNLL